MRATDLFEQTLAELSMPTTRDRAEILLFNAGYKPMGRGTYGAVFQKPDADYVLKLFDAKDSAYLDFIGLAKANPSPHFPKFVGKPVRLTPTYFAIRMEPLRPSRGMVEQSNLMHDYVVSVRDCGYARDDAREYVWAQPELRKALDLLAHYLKGSTDHMSDIHSQNLMMRGDTVVIVDPVAIYT